MNKGGKQSSQGCTNNQQEKQGDRDESKENGKVQPEKYHPHAESKKRGSEQYDHDELYEDPSSAHKRENEKDQKEEKSRDKEEEESQQQEERDEDGGSVGKLRKVKAR